MSRITSKLREFTVFNLTITMLASVSFAAPISGLYDDLPECDNHGIVTFDEEIGDAAVFPTDEAIFADAEPTLQVICVPDDGIQNDWEVRILNLSPNSFVDLFFVADEGSSVGNYDGLTQDLAGAPGVGLTSFRIDNVGVNQPLLAGDDGDLIFEPGEAWSFLVTNFNSPGLAPPIFASPGLFAGSSTNPNSNASIVANLYKIPEPTTCALMAMGLGAICFRRK